ncbi:hypothetical protein [uncultured Dubosiella sp.]|uniref:hypothetical protein n=2 Tax=uncultured Dubosiella sp. TaxID=1937011 RepID=UPI0025987232|nr:hypothetical protein [uncultured Dubosiella sp.]
MKRLKWVAAIAGIAAGAAGIAKVITDKKNKSLDNYLLPAPTDDESEEIPALKADILSWVGQDEKSFPVTLTFAVPDAKVADRFQEELARDGLSSSFDTNANVVDVLYNGESTIEGLTFLASAVINAMKTTDVQYQGFHFTK